MNVKLSNEIEAVLSITTAGDLRCVLVGGSEGAVVVVDPLVIELALATLEEGKNGWLVGHWVWINQVKNAVTFSHFPFSKYDRQTLTHKDLVHFRSELNQKEN